MMMMMMMTDDGVLRKESLPSGAAAAAPNSLEWPRFTATDAATAAAAHVADNTTTQLWREQLVLLCRLCSESTTLREIMDHRVLTNMWAGFEQSLGCAPGEKGCTY
jgi:hypothetical protein